MCQIYLADCATRLATDTDLPGLQPLVAYGHGVADSSPRRRPPGLVRQDPFDGLIPQDFTTGPWPFGAKVPAISNRIPRGLAATERAQAERQAMLAEEAAHELADEVQLHMRWKGRYKLSTSAIAREAGVSRARIAAFEQGTNWPRWDLLYRIRVLHDTYDG